MALGLFLLCQTAAAVELGELQIESAPGQTLDIRIPIIASPQELEGIRLLPHNVALYRKVSTEHTDLHERIVMELVATAKPYIAVSSIGAVNRKRFDLAVGLAMPKGELVKKYSVMLTPPPPPARNVLTAAQVLSQILNRIANATGMSRVAVLGGLRQVIGDEADAKVRRIIFRLGDKPPGREFTDGFRALLTDKAKAAFEKDLKARGALHAINRALFADPDHVVLKKLLSSTSTDAAYTAGGSDNQMDAMKEKMVAMENQITALKQLLEDESGGQKDSSRQSAPDSSWFESVRKYAAEQGLDKRTLFSRPFWFTLAGFWTLLLLLMLLRRHRYMRLVREQERKHKAALPGQRELEKELGHIASAATQTDGRESEINNRLNLAVTYIEMGDHIEAQEIIDTVIKEGTPSQIERARELEGKIKGTKGSFR